MSIFNTITRWQWEMDKAVYASFNIEDFCRKFKYFPVPVDSALKILTQAGYLEYTDEQDNASRLLFTIRRDELYKLRELGERYGTNSSKPFSAPIPGSSQTMLSSMKIHWPYALDSHAGKCMNSSST